MRRCRLETTSVEAGDGGVIEFGDHPGQSAVLIFESLVVGCDVSKGVQLQLGFPNLLLDGLERLHLPFPHPRPLPLAPQPQHFLLALVPQPPILVLAEGWGGGGVGGGGTHLLARRLRFRSRPSNVIRI